MIYIAAALITALSFAGAVQLDVSDPDGLYLHVVEPNGTVVTHYAGESGNSTLKFMRRGSVPTSVTANSKRDTGAHCNNIGGSPEDFLAAEGGLSSFFGSNGQSFASHISYKIGNGVAYGCDYGNGQTYTACQLSSDVDAIDSKCGTGGAGWSSHESWKSSYGRTLASEKFC
ncbi:hypothetical protein GP486_003578 [Trichoglossum hirsutum]|uniref:Uncharacterized protein n=1 Tax=Trichoglossum hirsutum TaxID=265104 RepID=A0A9P8RR02_9PEZI|nr:hypothetical protein GP486_003578 [Trichoglossum hirsutum]